MKCPDTGYTCFEVNCQLKGCQGDGMRRLLSATGPAPLPPRRLVGANDSTFNTETIYAAALHADGGWSGWIPLKAVNA